MRTIGILMLLFASGFFCGNIVSEILGAYQYNRQIGSFWNLAEKASTIVQKSEYIDKFVDAIKNAGMNDDYNAIILKTPDNSFNENFKALISLQGRLHDIQKMDIQSFAYQTAIQQITAQEQGEAKNMLEVFWGIWWKTHHFFLWNWVAFLNYIFVIIVGIFGAVLIAMRDEWN